MHHPYSTQEVREIASLYSLGTLPADQARAFEEHIRQGCALCMKEVESFLSVADELAYLAPRIEPAVDLRQKLLDRLASPKTEPALSPVPEPAHPRAGADPRIQVWKDWGSQDASSPFFLLRAEEEGWVQTAVPGVKVRRLYLDPVREAVTMLVRMEAGSSYPPHRHGGVEECYVLDGDLHVGETVMHAGDYQRVATDGVHPVQSTEGGCTLLILSSLHDEILA
jgi:quercetin dioxygenase-like cupin family protein